MLLMLLRMAVMTDLDDIQPVGLIIAGMMVHVGLGRDTATGTNSCSGQPAHGDSVIHRPICPSLPGFALLGSAVLEPGTAFVGVRVSPAVFGSLPSVGKVDRPRSPDLRNLRSGLCGS